MRGCAQLGQHRQRERRRLAGAGLRDAAQIAAVEKRRYRLKLDRRGGIISFGGKRGEDRLGEAKIGKMSHKYTFNGARSRTDAVASGFVLTTRVKWEAVGLRALACAAF